MDGDHSLKSNTTLGFCVLSSEKTEEIYNGIVVQ